jgi:HEAT repeat protein
MVAMVVLAFAAAGCGDDTLPGSNPDEKAIAASQLGVPGADENVDVLVRAIETEPEAVQMAAITALGRIGTEDAVAALGRYAGHESRSVRRAVAQALADVQPEAYPAAAEVLLEMGAAALPRGPGDDPDLQVRRAVTTALSVTAQPKAARWMAERLRDEYDELIRNASVMMIGRLAEHADLREVLGRDGALDVLLYVIETDNEKNRAWAVESLGKLGDPRALPAIEAALDDYDPVTRGKAAVALMRLQGREAAPRLREELETESADMPAVVMAHCLARMGEEEALPFLEDRVLNASDSFARAEAARVLREVGRRESMVALDRAFEEDRDGLVKREAGLAMRTLRAKFPPEEADAPAEQQ